MGGENDAACAYVVALHASNHADWQQAIGNLM